MNLAEFIRDPPKTHLLAPMLYSREIRTLCGLSGGFTYTVKSELSDCEECLRAINITQSPPPSTDLQKEEGGDSDGE
jgi:hypothetical protein